MIMDDDDPIMANTMTFANSGSLTVSPYYGGLSTLSSTTYTTTNTSSSPIISTNAVSPELMVRGDVDITGDIIIKGKSLCETLEGIEQRLGILKPNQELEEKWDKLKALGDMYRELEKEIIAQEEIYSILKK